MSDAKRFGDSVDAPPLDADELARRLASHREAAKQEDLDGHLTEAWITTVAVMGAEILEPNLNRLVGFTVHAKGSSHLVATLRAVGPMEIRASRVFDFIACVCPQRVWNEDLGDFMETVVMLERGGAPRWRCWLSIMAGVFWTLANAMREIQAARSGKKT